MEDISFSLEGICPIPSPIDLSLSPSPIDQSPSPIDQAHSPIQAYLTPIDPTPSPHEDEVNNVDAQRGICRLESKVWQHF